MVSVSLGKQTGQTWLRVYVVMRITSMGYAQQELTVLTIFLLVFTHVSGTTSQMTSPVRH